MTLLPAAMRALVVSGWIGAMLSALPCHADGPSATGGLHPNLEGKLDQAMRYAPDGADFVITNGTEFFNRSLYGGHTAFRVDGGDKPEFMLYLPGRGGNLRLAIRTGSGTKWLHEAATIVTRYRRVNCITRFAIPLWARTAPCRSWHWPTPAARDWCCGRLRRGCPERPN